MRDRRPVGVTDRDIVRRYPCDDFVVSPELQAWRGVRVEVPGGFMSYVLVREENDTTRLLLKVVMRTSRVVALGLCAGDLIMARRQLLTLKQLAERHHRGAT
jgi:hypothetical protein